MRVRLLVRAGSEHPDLAGLPLERVEGDLLDTRSLERAIRGARAVFHAAGLVSYRPADRRRLWRVNVEGTRNVLQAAARAGVEGVVVTGSIAGFGIPRTRQLPADEGQPFLLRYRGVGYLWTKHVSQREAMAFGRRASGPAVVVLAPATILGPGDQYRNAGQVVISVAEGRAGVAPPGSTSLVDVADVVSGHLRGWEHGRSGEGYVLATEVVGYAELLRRTADVLGVPGPRFELPRAAVFPCYAAGWLAGRLGGELSEQLMLLSFSRREFSARRARRELGWAPAHHLESMVRRTAEYYSCCGAISSLPASPGGASCPADA